MFAGLALLAYALRATRTLRFAFVCPSTVLSCMCAAQGCMYAWAWLARLVYALHATRVPQFVSVCSFTVLSYIFAAHGYWYAWLA
jgi:hypothetical protein